MGRLAKVGCRGWVAALWSWSTGARRRHVGGADSDLVGGSLAVSVIGVLISPTNGATSSGRAGGDHLRGRGAALLDRHVLSNFLPTSVGGDAVRLALTPSKGRLARVAGSILVERLTGLLVMLALCAIGLSLRPVQVDQAGLGQALPWRC
jgi:hypothetical protein